MNTTATIQDVIDQVVIPSLGEYADDYDIEAIAREITEWHAEIDEDGNEHVNLSGFRIIAEDDDFWAIAAKHAN